MATFLDILLLALTVSAIGNLISNFKGKKDNLFGKAAFPLLMLLIPAFYGSLVTQHPEPPEQSPETIYKTSTKSIGVAALKKAQSESKMLKSFIHRKRFAINGCFIKRRGTAIIGQSL